MVLLTARHTDVDACTLRPSGARVERRGGRLSVYAHAAVLHWRGGTGSPDVIVETQNGVPYLAALWAPRTKHVVLVHHVHREQWPVVFGPHLARVGWFIESRLAPWVNRRRPYVAVSDVTKAELGEQGIAPDRVRVIHNGTISPPPLTIPKTPHPQLLVMGRLVPHKRVELAVQALECLLPEFPNAQLVIAGRGWWHDEIAAEINRRGMEDHAHLLGFVSDEERQRLYAQSWVSLVPSIKEGWGLVVVEAGMHHTPTVAFRGTGGITESVVDGETGLLAAPDDLDDYVAAVRRLIGNESLRTSMGTAAEAFARKFTWSETVDRYEALFDELLGRGPTDHRSGLEVPQAELE